MPGVEINSHGIPAVEAIGAYLQELLDHAESAKPSRALEPALAKSDFDDIYGHVNRIFAGFDDPSGKKLRQYAIIETAARDIFGELIVSSDRESTALFFCLVALFACSIADHVLHAGYYTDRLARLRPRLEPV